MKLLRLPAEIHHRVQSTGVAMTDGGGWIWGNFTTTHADRFMYYSLYTHTRVCVLPVNEDVK